MLTYSVHRANQKYMYTLGLDETSWNDWSDVIHPEDVPKATTAWNQAMDTGKGYPNPVELRVRLAPVPEHYIDVCVSSILRLGRGTDAV
jgi:hypothetical protein